MTIYVAYNESTKEYRFPAEDAYEVFSILKDAAHEDEKIQVDEWVCIEINPVDADNFHLTLQHDWQCPHSWRYGTDFQECENRVPFPGMYCDEHGA